MLYRIKEYIETYRNRFEQGSRNLRVPEPDDIFFLHDVVAAGRAKISGDMQINLLADEDMNSALLVLRHNENPAQFCWNAYDYRPELKDHRVFEDFRPYIEAILHEEAKLSGRDLAILSKTTS